MQKSIECEHLENTLVTNLINIHENAPNISIGPHIENEGNLVPPFYNSLKIHNFTLHNYTIHSGASSYFMPK